MLHKYLGLGTGWDALKNYFNGRTIEKAPVTAGPSSCDLNHKRTEKEGNVGETALFPWLGVLRVHIHEGGTFRIALTGLVLVKEGYAIANADDVARIPKTIFKHDSKAMFIPRENEAWFCRLLDYMTHPEYRYATSNTIALLELDPGEERDYPMMPICWPPYSFNTSNHLYAIGFTDENELLEKSLYSLQYVETNLCKEFYTREGLINDGLTPSHYQCGTARQMKESCVWDNGMVLASNSSGHWTLVGFGVRGPGCAAPSRFIDMMSYLPWIETATGADDIPDQMDDYRKSAFNEGFRNRRRNGSAPILREMPLTPEIRGIIQHRYPFNTEQAQNLYYNIDRVEKDVVQIRHVSVPGNYGNCTARGLRLIYRDETKVIAKNDFYYPAFGVVQYKVSVYDLLYRKYSCVRIKLKSTNQEKATIYYRWVIDHMEGASFKDFGDTPEELLHVYPITPVTTKPTGQPDPDDWKPGPHLKVHYLKDKYPKQRQKNYNILLTFEFEGEGILQLDVLGFYFPTTTTTEPTTTQKKRRRHGDHSFEIDEVFVNKDEARSTDEVNRNRHELKQAEDMEVDEARYEEVDEIVEKPDIMNSALVNIASFGERPSVSLALVIVIETFTVLFLNLNVNL